jgi:hypothetical protein
MRFPLRYCRLIDNGGDLVSPFDPPMAGVLLVSETWLSEPYAGLLEKPNV